MHKMATQSNKTECTVTCWVIAALVGVLTMVLLYAMANFGIIQSIFTGGLAGCVLGLVLVLFICREQTAAADLAAARKSTAPVADAATTSAKAASASDAAVTTSAASAPDAPAPAAKPLEANTTPVAAMTIQPSKPLPGQQELADRKGTWKYEAEPKPASEPAAAKAKSAAKASEPAKAKPAAVSSTDDARPEVLMSAPRAGGADDLKLISGVGPKLEQTLNDLGVYHYDQVAKFKKKDIAWVDARLRFKGRIERDDWMSQARILAKGGETEFSKKKS